jgi:hypothetical protein
VAGPVRPPVPHRVLSAHTVAPPSPPAAPGGTVIALSRYRAQLQRGRRARRVDEIFASPDPERVIRALPGDELFYLISEIGFPEALDVLQHATASQVQTVLDFALWERDQVPSERADEWLRALVMAPPATVVAWIRGLDVELCALLLRRRARIYDLSIDEPPDEPEGSLLNTPDNLFTLDLLGEGDEPGVTHRLVDALYREDQTLARRLLIGVRSELDSELEELAYRWRSGRMADLGFVEFYEALEAYRELDPAQVAVQAGGGRARPATERASYLRLPGALAERLAAGGTPFARAVAAVADADEVAELHFALVALCNRVLSADRVSPADHDKVAIVLARVASTLDLAVEFLGRGSDERATAAVVSVPMMVIFRVGVSLVAKVKKLALALERQTPFARAGLHLFEPEDSDVLAAVTQLRPLFPRRLDAPPAAGERPFGSLGDVATATAALERAGAGIILLHGLGARPEQMEALLEGVDPSAVDAGVLARTLLVDRLTGGTGGPPRRLPADALTRFAERFPGGGAAPLLQREVRDILTSVAPGRTLTPAMSEVAARWAGSLLPLEPVLTTSGVSDPR